MKRFVNNFGRRRCLAALVLFVAAHCAPGSQERAAIIGSDSGDGRIFGTTIASFSDVIEIEGRLRDLTIAPDGERAFAVDHRGILYVLAIENGAGAPGLSLLETVDLELGAIESIAVSRDGALLFLAGFQGLHAVNLIRMTDYWTSPGEAVVVEPFAFVTEITDPDQPANYSKVRVGPSGRNLYYIIIDDLTENPPYTDERVFGRFGAYRINNTPPARSATESAATATATAPKLFSFAWEKGLRRPTAELMDIDRGGHYAFTGPYDVAISPAEDFALITALGHVRGGYNDIEYGFMPPRDESSGGILVVDLQPSPTGDGNSEPGDYLLFIPTLVEGERNYNANIADYAVTYRNPVAGYWGARAFQAESAALLLSPFGLGAGFAAQAYVYNELHSIYTDVYRDRGFLKAYSEIYSNDLAGVKGIAMTPDGELGIAAMGLTNNAALLELSPSYTLGGYSTREPPGNDRIFIRAAIERTISGAGGVHLFNYVSPSRVAMTADGSRAYIGLRKDNFGFLEIREILREVEQFRFSLTPQSLIVLRQDDMIHPSVAADLETIQNEVFQSRDQFEAAIRDVTDSDELDDDTLDLIIRRAVIADSLSERGLPRDLFHLTSHPNSLPDDPDTQIRDPIYVTTFRNDNVDGDLLTNHIEAHNRFNAATFASTVDALVGMVNDDVTGPSVHNDDLVTGAMLPQSGLGYRVVAKHGENRSNAARPSLIRLVERIGRHWHAAHLQAPAEGETSHNYFVINDLSPPGWGLVTTKFNDIVHIESRIGRTMNINYFRVDGLDEPFDFVISNNAAPLDNSVPGDIANFDAQSTYDLITLLVDTLEVTEIAIDPDAITAMTPLDVDIGVLTSPKLIVRAVALPAENDGVDNDENGATDEPGETGIRRDMDTAMRVRTRDLHVNLVGWEDGVRLPEWEEERPGGAGLLVDAAQLVVETVGVGDAEIVIRLFFAASEVSIDGVANGGIVQPGVSYAISQVSSFGSGDFSDVEMVVYNAATNEPVLADRISVVSGKADLEAGIVPDAPSPVRLPVGEAEESLPNGRSINLGPRHSVVLVPRIRGDGDVLRIFFDDSVVSIGAGGETLRSGDLVPDGAEYEILDWLDEDVVISDVVLKMYDETGVFLGEDRVTLSSPNITIRPEPASPVLTLTGEALQQCLLKATPLTLDSGTVSLELVTDAPDATAAPIPVIRIWTDAMKSVAPILDLSDANTGNDQVEWQLSATFRLEDLPNQLFVEGVIAVPSIYPAYLSACVKDDSGVELSRHDIPISFHNFEAVTGVTPSAGREVPVPWMSVFADVQMHDLSLKLTHINSAVPGRMLPVVIGQTYRSNISDAGPLGRGWTPNWYEYIAVIGDLYRLHSGDGRIDDFIVDTEDPTLLQVPKGYTVKAEVMKDGDRVEVTATDGTVTIYEDVDATPADPRVLRIRSVTDRFNNRITYEYDGSGRLEKIIDDMRPIMDVGDPDDVDGREYTFEYNDDGADVGALASISDFDGLRYTFRVEDGLLLSVIVEDKDDPAVSTGITYTYDEHNRLETVTVGYESEEDMAATIDDHEFLRFDYDDAVATAVARLICGGPVDMFDETFVSERIADMTDPPPENPDEAIGSVTTYTDADDVVWTYRFDVPGAPSLCSEVVQDPDNFRLTTTHEYNDELRLTKNTYPLLNTVSIEYDTPTTHSAIDKRGLANVRKTTYAKGDREDADGGVDFNSVKALTEQRTYYGENEYYQLASVVNIDKSVYSYEYGEPKMSLTRVEFPLQDGNTAPITYSYNARGQLIKKKDLDGSVTTYDYNQPAGDTISPNEIFEGVDEPTVQAAAAILIPVQEGYLFKTTVEASSDKNLDTDYIVGLVRDKYGRVVAYVDAKQGTNVNFYNRLGQLMITGSPPVIADNNRSRPYRSRVYDLRGRLIESHMGNPVASGTSVSNPMYNYVVTSTTNTYDDLNRPLSSSTPVQSDDGRDVYVYESNRERLSHVNHVNGSYTIYEYDSAGRIQYQTNHHTDADPQSPLPNGAVVTELIYDLDSNVVEQHYYYGVDVPRAQTPREHELEIIRDWSGRAARTLDVISNDRTERGWNNRGQMTQKTTYCGQSGKKVSDVQYAYHPNGDTKSVVDVLSRRTLDTDYDYKRNSTSHEFNASHVREIEHETTTNSVGHAFESNYAGIGVKRVFDINGNLRKSAPFAPSGNTNIHLADANETIYHGHNDHVKQIRRPDLDVNDSQRSAVNLVSSGSGPPGIVVDEENATTTHSLDEASAAKVVTGDAGDPTDERRTGSYSNRNERWNIVARGIPGEAEENQATQTYYDQVGRVIRKEYHYGLELPPDLEIKEDLGNGDVSEVIEYDHLSRPSRRTFKDGSFITFHYYSRTHGNSNNRDQLALIRDADGDVLRAFGDYNCFGFPETLTEYYNPGDGDDYVITEIDYVGSGGSASPGFGKIKSETTTVYSGGSVASPPQTVRYIYDGHGRRERMYFPDEDRSLRYRYVNDTLLKSVTKLDRSGKELVTLIKYTRDDAFRVITKKRIYDQKSASSGSNGVTIDIDYKSMRMGLAETFRCDDDLFATFTYDRRGLKDGTAQWATASGPGQVPVCRKYEYDGLRRLRNVQVTDPDGDKFAGEAFVLDSYENADRSVVDGLEVNYRSAGSSGTSGFRNQYSGFSNPDDAIVSRIGTAGDSTPQMWHEFNFQPESGEPVGDYFTDNGNGYGYDRATNLTHGWVDTNTGEPLEKSAADVTEHPPIDGVALERLSSISLPAGSSDAWELLVENGDYRVEIVAGDPADVSPQRYQVDAEGISVVDGTNDPEVGDYWITGTRTISVTDNRLTISGGIDGGENRLCFISVASLKNPVYRTTRFNMQADDVPAVRGYVSATGMAFTVDDHSGYHFGWRDGPAGTPVARAPHEILSNPSIPGRTRVVSTAITLPSSPARVWELELEDGAYRVTVLAGNSGDEVAQPYQIDVEGSRMIDGINDPQSGDYWLSNTALVEVKDGFLTVSGGNTGGSNALCSVTVESIKRSRIIRLTHGDDDDIIDFEYDARGRLIEDHQFLYTWDDFDRIASVTDKYWRSSSRRHPSPRRVQYRYDAMGRRIAQIFSGQTEGWPSERLVYDGLQLIEERDFDSGNILRRYFYEEGLNRLIAVEQTNDNDNDVDDFNDDVFVVLTDDRGTVMGVTDENGNILEKLHLNATGLMKCFDPETDELMTNEYGLPVYRSAFVRFGWTGMYKDPFTGKFHTHFRDYDPIHNRWLSEDPAGYQDGLNLYAAYGNVNARDMLGLAVTVMTERGKDGKFDSNVYVDGEYFGRITGGQRYAVSDRGISVLDYTVYRNGDTVMLSEIIRKNDEDFFSQKNIDYLRYEIGGEIFLSFIAPLKTISGGSKVISAADSANNAKSGATLLTSENEGDLAWNSLEFVPVLSTIKAVVDTSNHDRHAALDSFDQLYRNGFTMNDQHVLWIENDDLRDKSKYPSTFDDSFRKRLSEEISDINDIIQTAKSRPLSIRVGEWKDSPHSKFTHSKRAIFYRHPTSKLIVVTDEFGATIKILDNEWNDQYMTAKKISIAHLKFYKK